MTDDYPFYTPYQYAGNEPIANVDMDGLEPSLVTKITNLGGGTWNTFVKPAARATQTASSTGGIVSKGLSIASIGASVGKIGSNIISKTSEQWGILKWNASNRWDNFKQAVSDEFDDIKAGVEIAAKEQGKPLGVKWIEATLGGDLSDPMTLFGGLGPIGRVKGMRGLIKNIKVSEEMGGLMGTKGVLDPKEIHFMQNNIKNQTGEFTVLGNAHALKSGALDPEVLRMNIWKDANGKIWTLDHRRLAAFRLSGLQDAPIKWADPADHLWKMSTENFGTSIWLKFGGGNGLTIK